MDKKRCGCRVDKTNDNVALSLVVRASSKMPHSPLFFTRNHEIYRGGKPPAVAIRPNKMPCLTLGLSAASSLVPDQDGTITRFTT
jgi:hypothetical protein